MTMRLRYDGKYEPSLGGMRQWTILSHFIDCEGADRFMGSFTEEALMNLLNGGK